MSSLTELVSAIQKLVQDTAFGDDEIVSRINDAVQGIAAGLRMPNGQTSPPLPDLFKLGTVATTTAAFTSLPSDYQRGVTAIYDSSGYRIPSPQGGYYSFNQFMKGVARLSLDESGSVYRVCVKGTKLYYQGIPSAETTLGVHYYRQPDILALDGDTPDGIPAHLHMRLVKHKVLAEVFAEALEDGQDNMGVAAKYHNIKFYEAMTDLIDFIGIDEGPSFYGEESSGFGSL
jgi:hypothetical protein